MENLVCLDGVLNLSKILKFSTPEFADDDSRVCIVSERGYTVQTARLIGSWSQIIDIDAISWWILYRDRQVIMPSVKSFDAFDPVRHIRQELCR